MTDARRRAEDIVAKAWTVIPKDSSLFIRPDDIERLIDAIARELEPQAVSDEEIKQMAKDYGRNYYRPSVFADGYADSFLAGARWAASRNAVARMPSEEDTMAALTVDPQYRTELGQAYAAGVERCYRFILSRLGGGS